VKLFLLPFSSHCSTQNIGFNDSGYVIKPPQPSSAIYGAPPFTGNLNCVAFNFIALTEGMSLLFELH